jgi:predicted enzyme related to lactoylglutathione lyase
MEIVHVKVMLRAQEMWRGVTFWRDVFGLSVRFGDDEWTEMVSGDALIVLTAGHDGSERQSRLSLEVDDLEAAVEAVLSGGGRLIGEPHRPKGQTFLIASVVDTEGNRFRITQGA